jgi:hypothetical protein
MWRRHSTLSMRATAPRSRKGRLAGLDPPATLTLIYRMFTTLLSWTMLCARSDTTKDIEILVLRHQLERRHSVSGV